MRTYAHCIRPSDDLQQNLVYFFDGCRGCHTYRKIASSGNIGQGPIDSMAGNRIRIWHYNICTVN